MKASNLSRIISITSLLTGLLFFSSCGNDEYEIPLHPANNLPVGASRVDFLSEKKYDKMIVEIQYTAGNKPDEKAIDRLSDFLQDYLMKPDGIEIHTTQISVPVKSTYTINDIKAIELNNREYYTEGTTIAAYFFLADGKSADNNGNTSCLPYKNTSMVVFTNNILDTSSAPAYKTTSSLLIHVLGHNLGSTKNDGTNSIVGCPLEHAG